MCDFDGIKNLAERARQLHRLVYVVAIAGVIHFYWLVKADVRRPVQYGAVLALLLGYWLVVKGLRSSPESLPPNHPLSFSHRCICLRDHERR